VETLGISQIHVKPVHNQVGAGADEREGATENGGVTECHQQRGQGYLLMPRPARHGRDEGGHHRGIVQEAAEAGDRRDYLAWA